MRGSILYGLAGASALSLLISADGYSKNKEGKPNVLVILTDQQSAESMSFNIGHRFLNTPNMDSLAANGVSFTNAYCANPLCIPSRSSMFTGRYPHEMGIQANDKKTIDPVLFPTLGTMFRNGGYETGYTGKWHLPYDVNAPDTHGFQYMANIKGNGVDSLIPQSAIKFLEARRTNPFFLVVSFVNPHNICEWARGQKLPDGPVGEPPAADQCPPLRPNHLPSANETDIMEQIRRSYQANEMFPVSGFSDAKWRQYLWAYYRMIEKVDRQMGEVLSALRKSGLDKNTIVVFLSDHGDCQGAHLWNQKTVFYEEAAKVPFIVSFKGINPRKSDILVQTGIDLMPTLCDLAGISTEKQNLGKSLKKIILHGEERAWRNYIVVSDRLEQGAPLNGIKLKPEGRMLRNNRFKYWIYNEGSQRETLYDLQSDPGEMINLANHPDFKTELENCRKQLADWGMETNDPFVGHLKH